MDVLERNSWINPDVYSVLSVHYTWWDLFSLLGIQQSSPWLALLVFQAGGRSRWRCALWVSEITFNKVFGLLEAPGLLCFFLHEVVETIKLRGWVQSGSYIIQGILFEHLEVFIKTVADGKYRWKDNFVQQSTKYCKSSMVSEGIAMKSLIFLQP